MSAVYDKELHNERTREAMRKSRKNGLNDKHNERYKRLKNIGFHWSIAGRLKYFSDENLSLLNKSHIDLELDEIIKILKGES